MPESKSVPSLRHQAVTYVADLFHRKCIKATSRGKKTAPPSLNVDEFCECLHQWLEQVPPTLCELLLAQMQRTLNVEKAILDETYYVCLRILLNGSTRSLELNSTRFFQDSSMALDTFLCNLGACSQLQELRLSKEVVDLVCFNFAQVLQQICSLRQLEVLVLPDLRNADVSKSSLKRFLVALSRSCQKLRHLDLTSSDADDSCCDIVARLPKLQVLCLEKCHVTTLGAVKLLNKLKFLQVLECDGVLQNALATRECPGALALRSLSLRLPVDMANVAKKCPDAEHIRVKYNDNGTDFSLDKNLAELNKFQYFERERLDVRLDYNGTNLLFLIQMEGLEVYGRCLVEVTLTECEFAHAQTLNPLAKHCPSLRVLSLLKCSTVGDDMFEGELPPLQEAPFPALRELTVMGSLPLGLAGFLLKAAHRLAMLKLYLAGSFSSVLLELLVCTPRDWLDRMFLSIERTDADFVERLRQAILCSPSLSHVEVAVWDADLKKELQRLERDVKMRNWQMTFLYFVKPKPRQNNPNASANMLASK